MTGRADARARALRAANGGADPRGALSALTGAVVPAAKLARLDPVRAEIFRAPSGPVRSALIEPVTGCEGCGAPVLGACPRRRSGPVPGLQVGFERPDRRRVGRPAPSLRRRLRPVRGRRAEAVSPKAGAVERSGRAPKSPNNPRSVPADVKWRPRVVECCESRAPIELGTGAEPPVWWCDPHGRTARVVMCPGCGSTWAADVLEVVEVRP